MLDRTDRLAAYFRGILFCVLAAAAIGGFVGFFIVPVVGLILGAGYVLIHLGIQIAICAPVGVYIALRSDRQSSSIKTIKRKTAIAGALIGGLIGLTDMPLHFILSSLTETHYKSAAYSFWDVMFEVLFSWYRVLFAGAGAIAGMICGWFLPWSLGDALQARLLNAKRR